MITDTIAAIATPLMASAIGIIRVSGDNVPKLIDQFFNTSYKTLQPRKMITAIFIDPNTNAAIDDCCFVYFKAPHSYTGEDSLEIYCHGSVYVCQTICGRLIQTLDCRLAKNGEFTQRAFINGKIPLEKAESVLNIIESTNESTHRIAINNYQGKVFDTIRNLREELMSVCQRVEASLEFPDDVGPIQNETTVQDLKIIQEKLTPIITHSDFGEVIKKGLRYIIVGEPNVGKSSLLNALSAENRSIVSKTPGTTRDYIDITIDYQGISITVIDTAGLRTSTDDIEQQGMAKINDLLSSVDGCIYVLDGSKPITTNTPPTVIPNTLPIITVINKSDIHQGNVTSSGLHCSCITMDGINQLKAEMLNRCINMDQFDSSSALCNLRQINALKKATSTVSTAIEQIQQSSTLDVISIDLQDAIRQLGDVSGDDVSEELIDGIFSKFCIGK